MTTTTSIWEAGSAGELGQRHGMEQIGFWRKLLAHPGYDAWWKDQAVERKDSQNINWKSDRETARQKFRYRRKAVTRS